MFTLKSVTYRSILKIDELEIGTAEVTAITGESGSGKTTLLKMLNHMITPDEGDVMYNGKSIKDIDPVKLRRHVMMLPQHPVLFAETIRENLQAGLNFSEKPEATEEAMKKALAEVSLGKDLDENAEKLSGGEQQRLALARILLADPEVFLLDEPTSALDDDLEQKVMKQFFDHTKKKGKKVIMVTHARKMAEELSDELVEIEPFVYKGDGRA